MNSAYSELEQLSDKVPIYISPIIKNKYISKTDSNDVTYPRKLARSLTHYTKKKKADASSHVYSLQ